VRRQQLRGTASSALVLSIQGSNLPSDGQQEQQALPPFERPLLPEPDKLGPIKPEKERPLVRVQLSVHYRVHSRQILCIGGSQIPFGWSFLSIAKVPMTWNRGDVWTCEVGRQIRAAGVAVAAALVNTTTHCRCCCQLDSG
jgi:hypothetical protein